MSGRCRSCDAPLVWARTGRGKAMPLVPDPDGNIVIRNGIAVVLAGDIATAQPSERTFVSHFATCPQAGKWRR